MRLPVILTLMTAILLLINTLGFHDIEMKEDSSTEQEKLSGGSLLDPFRKIFIAGKWTISNRFVLFVILAALVLDSVGRQFGILSSEYYRLIDIPVSWFGLIGAAMSLMGILNAMLSRHLVHHRSPFFNFILLSGILMLGLIGITFCSSLLWVDLCSRCICDDGYGAISIKLLYKQRSGFST